MQAFSFFVLTYLKLSHPFEELKQSGSILKMRKIHIRLNEFLDDLKRQRSLKQHKKASGISMLDDRVVVSSPVYNVSQSFVKQKTGKSKQWKV